MIKFIGKTNIDFVGKRFAFFAISGAVMLAGIISLSVKGMNLGLDFTGGTMLQVAFEKPVAIAEMRKAMSDARINAVIQSYTGRNAYSVRVKGKQDNVNEVADRIIGAFETSFKDNKFTEEKRDYVGPVVGRDLAKKAMFAIVLSLFGIILYIAFRFSNPVWGGAAIVATGHDLFITLTALSLTNREIDLVVVAALLATAGYSVNDTIVIFDRMRENIRKFPKMPLGQLINSSVNETISRTIITNLTTLSVVLILFIFGGDVINDFAFTMLIGCIVGTYSTMAIATQTVYQWEGKGR
ncbi:MAG: preprotein translocase subunit SecF [Elusimicrobia bacterium]|nr:MAG: preprotein translocase subunit SecF [Elusimicrobiota bacterium]KAF0156610.1 MAG: preprotein translocase subunit SecF [Elusimicrobiota bacterium]